MLETFGYLIFYCKFFYGTPPLVTPNIDDNWKLYLKAVEVVSRKETDVSGI